nr:helix-turn-helix domain-containing protein [Thalassobius sp. Cn5-15]
MLGVTTPHLTRCCKEAAGHTAAHILSARALFAARDMIERSDLPIQDIAAQLHFGTAAYFSRFVTKHTGASPLVLRKRQRAKV